MSTYGILNKSIVLEKFTYDDDFDDDDWCGDIESFLVPGRNLMMFFSYKLCKDCAWLWIVLSIPRKWFIVWFPEVVDTTTALHTDNRNNNKLILHKERPVCTSSTLTFVKLRLDYREVSETTLAHAQHNRSKNVSFMASPSFEFLITNGTET